MFIIICVAIPSQRILHAIRDLRKTEVDVNSVASIHMHTHTYMFSHTKIYIHKQVKDSVISTTILHFKGVKSNTFFFLVQRLRIQSNLMKT